jgi:hypothetical protein
MFLSWSKVQKMDKKMIITSDNLSMILIIRCTRKEKKLIKQLSKNCGLSVSRFILAAVHKFKLLMI